MNVLRVRVDCVCVRVCVLGKACVVCARVCVCVCTHKGLLAGVLPLEGQRGVGPVDLFRVVLHPPELQVSTPPHAKHPGWYVDLGCPGERTLASAL